MSLLNRVFRLSLLCMLALVPRAAFAQTQIRPQFVQPGVEQTGGRVTDIVPGLFHPTGLSDLLYVDAFQAMGTTYQVTAGFLLNHQGFTNLNENQITFSNVLGVSAATGDFDGDGHTDFAFGLFPSVLSGGNDLCVYYGTGADIGAPTTSPIGAESGCMAFPIQGTSLPRFSYIASEPFRTDGLSQLILEDSNNDYLYIVANNGAGGSSGALPGFTVKATYAINPSDGAGPIYTGDFNNDGNMDFIVNGQNGLSASVYFGNGDGTFQPPKRYTFDHHVHSMLLQDMDLDGLPDMVVEGDGGVIEIFKGYADGVFATASEGGASAGGFFGGGGHLAAIGKLGNDINLDILVATPIGLGVLQGQGNLAYTLKGVYNIGPGRSAYALADYNGDGYLDLAVDSPEGVAIVYGDGNGDGGFQTSLAYAAGQPALNATIADFNNDGKLDVVVGTGTIQGQVLLGNGAGAFTPLPAPTNTVPSPNSSLWSAVLTGDFDGDGKQDLLYSLTGLPLPTPGPGAGSGLYLQYGNGDGTFGAPQPISNQMLGAPANNNFYGESAVADLNGDGIADIANIDAFYYDTLLSQKAAGAFKLGLSVEEDSGTSETGELDSFSQVAVGDLSGTRTNQQDLVFQDDANIVPYQNTAAGVKFTAMPALSSPPPIGSYYGGTILLADIDGDGNGDIVVPYQNLAASPISPSAGTANQLYIWYGHGDGTFDPPVITTLSRNYYLAQIADMNNDGLPDIVLSDGFLVSVLYNEGNRTFGTLANGGEQHFLAGQGINSISIADVNGDGSPDIVVSNGGLTISGPVAIGGLTQVSISLTPNPDVNTGGITVLTNSIHTRAVKGAVASSPNPSAYQSQFTLTATLNPTAGVPPPTGTVTFSIDGGQPVVATVVPGASSSTASLVIPQGNTYTNGEHTLLAAYNGDAYNSPINLYGTHLVQGSTTATTLYLCIGPTLACPSIGVVQPPAPPYPTGLTMYYGQTFNGISQVTSLGGNALTGSIAFNDDYNGVTSTLCTLPVATAGSCPPSVGTTQGTSVGTNIFTAVYSGDTDNQPSSSPSVTILVLPDTTGATLTGTPNPSPFGQPVTFTATFTGNYAPPAGQATLLYGSTPLGTATLNPGATGFASTATFTTAALPVGTDTVSVSYAATMNFNATGAAATETITPVLPTRTTLTSSLNPSSVGQSVTVTATESLAGGASSPVPTGTVTFFDGTAPLGSGTLSSAGVATFTTATLAAGSHNITAASSGDSATAPSTSSVLVQVVDALPLPGSVNFTITVTPSPVTIGVGNAATLLVTVTPLNGFTQGVNLGCSNLPTESACTFAASSIPGGGGSTQLLLSTLAPHNCGSTQPYFTGDSGSGPGNLPFALPVLAGLAVFFLPGRRRWLRSLIAIAAIAGAMQITGCGNCTDLGTRPNTYTIRVTGAAAYGTPELESQSVTMNVTI